MALSGYGIPDTGSYDRQASDLQYRFNTDSATNAYGRFLSQQRGTRSLTDMTQGFNRQLPNVYSSFNNRGLSAPGVQSGTQQRAMQNYLGDYATGYTRQQQDTTGQLQQFDMTQANLSGNLQDQLASIEASKQRDIANAALGIEALRPYLGGN